MIFISVPRQGVDKYISFDGFVWGPIGTDPKNSWESISYRSPYDILINRDKRIYHEKNVQHHQRCADMAYHPIRVGQEDVPTVADPDAIKLPWGANATKTGFRYGIIESGCTKRTDFSYGPRQFAFSTDGQDRLICYALTGNNPGTYIQSAQHIIYTAVAPVSSNSFSVRKDIITYTPYPLGGYQPSVGNIRVSMTYDEVYNLFLTTSCVSKFLGTPTWTTTTVNYPWQPSPNGAMFTMDGVKAVAEKELITIYDAFSDAPSDIDFGELAVEASERVNATHINVLQFLADLRRPQELIPKLASLRALKRVDRTSLKGASDLYLTVNYGILPTISDLRSIVDAFTRIGPNLDRFGSSCYYAGKSQQSDVRGISFERRQHLKLALSNEDHGLLSAFNALEKIGVFPSFNNLWDLIPLSFVVDWFLDIGNFLARVDTHLRLLRYDVRYTTMSSKLTGVKSVTSTPGSPYSGTFSLVEYSRWTSGRCPLPSLSYLTSHVSDFNHWIESASLLIQRDRRF